jgi:nitrate reductase delta subunit
MRLLSRRGDGAATAYKLCSLFLQYPDETLLAARQELADGTAKLPGSPAASALRSFTRWWTTADPLALAEHYVETFDLDKRCGLYLSFYGEGDRRGRGAALLRLKRLYRAAGLPLDGSELPDFLPVMLEFAAAAPDGRGAIVLREHRPALELLRRSLHERGTAYAQVLDAVCLTVGDLSATERARAVQLAAAGPPQELVGIEPFAPAEATSASEARR